MRPGQGAAARSARSDAGRVLVLGLTPYQHSHRAGKIARSYAARRPTTYLSLRAAGRSAQVEQAGTWEMDGLTVRQVPVRPPRDGRSALVPWLNLLLSYLPGLVRLSRAVVGTPAQIVHVNGPALLVLGLLHRWRHGSVLVLEVDEKPGSAEMPRSVATLFRPVEPLVLRLGVGRVAVVVTVTEGHRRLLEDRYGFTRHVVARNAPELALRGAFAEPPAATGPAPVVFVVASSIFEGRCFEMLVEAGALLARSGAPVRVRVAGYGRPEYTSMLHRLIQDLGAQGVVELLGPVPQPEVARLYADGHVGLSLYEPELDHNDSLPNKVLEAISFGRPVLATGQPDVAAFITATGTGWLTECSAEQIAASMTVIADQVRSGSVDLLGMARRCRQLGDTELNWEHEFAPVLAAVGLEADQPSPTTTGPAGHGGHRTSFPRALTHR